MARGQKIDELYISLGLDVAHLQLDFDTAGKTVSQTIARLNSKNNQIKLRMDADLSKLEGVGSALDKIRTKQEAINKQLDLQRKKEEILANVLKEAQKTRSNSGLTQNAQTNLLRQQKQVAALEAELRKLNKAYKNAGGNASAFGKGFYTSMKAAKSGISQLTSGMSLLSAKTAAVMTIMTTGAGLFTLTRNAMQAGEGIYRLTQRLHTSAGEASELSRTFNLAGTSIDAVVPFFARLDKQILSAGENGNNTTQALENFGVVLTDQKGNLLPINEQLARLAKGYQAASDAGQEEAFTAEVLGARGASLIPVLEQYTELMQISSSIKTTGLLNPEEAHATYLRWKAMEMEAGQLKMALGAALLPAANDLMPNVIEAFQDLVDYIHDNKDAVEDLGSVIGTFAQTAVDLLKGVGEAMQYLGISAEGTKESLQDIGTFAKHDGISMILKGALTGAAGGAVLGSAFPIVGTTAGLIGGAFLGAAGTYEAAKQSDRFKEWKEEDAAHREQKKAVEESGEALKKNSEEQQKNALTARKNAAAVKAVAKANTELKEALFGISHNDLEKSLHAVDTQVQKFRDAGASIDLIQEFQKRKQAQIYADFQRAVVEKTNDIYHTDLENQMRNIDREVEAYRKKGLDEVKLASWAAENKAKVQQEFENNVAANIDSIWQSALKRRLEEIEREKQAWIQKGLDEVKATQWAEKAKLDAQREAAIELLKNRKKELEAFREGGEKGLLDYYREAAGLTWGDLNFRPEELQQFEAAKKRATDNILPYFSSDPEVQREQDQRVQQLNQYRQDKMIQTGWMDGTAYIKNNAAYADQFDQGNISRLNDPQGTPASQGQPVENSNNFPINVTLNIENSVTETNEGMEILADHVANKIKPVIEQAVGGQEYAY